jgi:hypothetical protein
MNYICVQSHYIIVALYFGQSTPYPNMFKSDLYISRMNITSEIRKRKPCYFCPIASASLCKQLLPSWRHFKYQSWYPGRRGGIVLCYEYSTFKTRYKQIVNIGRDIAQAVSRRLPTTAARVQTRVGMWDFVIDKSSAGAGFLWKLRFPLPIYIPSCSPQLSSLSPEAGTIGQEWPQCL